MPSVVDPISSTATTVAKTKPKLEGFELARDTLKKLPLSPHEIDEHGFPCIPVNTALDERNQRRKEVEQYTAHFYATNLALKEKFKEDAVNNLNKILEDIGAFNPSNFVKQPLSYIIRPDVLRSSHVIALMHSDPLITLNLITGRGCGLNSGDISVKKGSLNMLIALGKLAEHCIQGAKNINKNLINGLSTISLIREILYKQQERSYEPKISEHIKIIDNEFKEIESKALEKCKTLGKEKNQEEKEVQEEHGEVNTEYKDSSKQRVKISSLDLLD